MRKIFPHSEAHQILAPHLEKIAAAMEQAFINFQQVISLMPENSGYIQYTRRAKATLLHEHISNQIEETFRNVADAQTGTWNGIFGLKINDALFIRFKKLKRDFSISGIKTKQFKRYQRQLSIEGFPDEPTFLSAGYIPNKTWTGMLGIYIICRIGEELQWVEELIGGTSMVQNSLFEIEPESTETRVKVKSPKESDTKTGTDG